MQEKPVTTQISLLMMAALLPAPSKEAGSVPELFLRVISLAHLIVVTAREWEPRPVTMGIKLMARVAMPIALGA